MGDAGVGFRAMVSRCEGLGHVLAAAAAVSKERGSKGPALGQACSADRPRGVNGAPSSTSAITAKFLTNCGKI